MMRVEPTMTNRCLGPRLLLAVLCGGWLQAQPVRPAAIPKFEVVSVKPCKPGAPSAGARGGTLVMGADSTPGRLSTGCGLLANPDNTGLLQVAYNRYASGRLTSTTLIPIEGVPEWVYSERFAIDAKADGHPTIQMMQGPMMQTILEDRFKLKIHRETRQGPVYELSLGKGSPKLKPYREGSCILVLAGRPMPELLSGQRYCRRMVGRRSLDIEGGTLTEAAGLLGMVLDRPVIDKTGLTNPVEIHLVFSPEDSAAVRSVFCQSLPQGFVSRSRRIWENETE